MWTEASFQQILESKIKTSKSPHDVNKAAQQGSEPAHLAYLMGHIHQTFFRPPPQPQLHKIYPSRPKPSSPQTPPPPPSRPPHSSPPHSLSEEQQVAFSFFNLYEVPLSPAFSQKELKKAFRTLALRLHPDMNKGAQSAFIELKSNYEKLNRLFN